MDKDTNIFVFGLGISNMSVIRYLVDRGYSVTAWDDNENARDKAKELGAQISQPAKDFDLFVVAPGVPHSHAVFQIAKDNNIETICDIELRYRMGWACKTVGITGTNGKSTTTALIGHTLNQAGINAVIGGNIGMPICDLNVPDENGVLVLELSSFQLDLCSSFRPDIAVLTNITPDHLDRHGTMESYVAAKACMFEGAGDAIFSGHDKYSQKIKNDTDRIILNVPANLSEQPTLRGQHNIENMQAAYAVCARLDVSHDNILKGFETFPGLAHRQFLVRTIGSVHYINDSKATNAEAATKALGSFDTIYWIVGGVPKEGGLEGCEPYLDRIQKAYVIGDHADAYTPYLDAHNVAYEVIKTMEGAVHAAHKHAQAGGDPATVLLSPAAASFDQYKNFEKRGEDFERVVCGL
jgi:UDP-N-acetylmuramoylalanine--D-glutamate ligase